MGNYVNGTTFKKLNVAIFLLGSTIFIHENLQKMVGFGPNWSIDMAKKYCAKAEWIYLDTTPLYTLMRYPDSALGLALSNLSSSSQNSIKSTVFKIPIYLLIGFTSHYVHKNMPNDLD